MTVQAGCLDDLPERPRPLPIAIARPATDPECAARWELCMEFEPARNFRDYVERLQAWAADVDAACKRAEDRAP